MPAQQQHLNCFFIQPHPLARQGGFGAVDNRHHRQQQRAFLGQITVIAQRGALQLAGLLLGLGHAQALQAGLRGIPELDKALDLILIKLGQFGAMKAGQGHPIGIRQHAAGQHDARLWIAGLGSQHRLAHQGAGGARHLVQPIKDQQAIARLQQIAQRLIKCQGCMSL